MSLLRLLGAFLVSMASVVAMSTGLDAGLRPPVLVPDVPLSTVLGLGDSVPAGTACSCTSYITLLARHRAIAARNLAQGGLTSAGLLTEVRRDHVLATTADITVITIGANDFNSRVLSTSGCRTTDQLACYSSDLTSMTANVAATLVALGGHHGPILLTGYWNVFLDGAVGSALGSAYVRDSDALTLEVNAALQRVAVAHGAWYVDIYAPFKSRGAGETALLAADGDHPSAAGHAVIAAALVKALARHGY